MKMNSMDLKRLVPGFAKMTSVSRATWASRRPCTILSYSFFMRSVSTSRILKKKSLILENVLFLYHKFTIMHGCSLPLIHQFKENEINIGKKKK